MHEADYERARKILKEAMNNDTPSSDEEKTCPKCSEPNPENFEICYACGIDI